MILRSLVLVLLSGATLAAQDKPIDSYFKGLEIRHKREQLEMEKKQQADELRLKRGQIRNGEKSFKKNSCAR